MARLMRTFLLVLLCFCLATPSVYAAPEGDAQKATSGPRRQLAIIVFSGLGGAVLGLSTLSFYGRPQDYLANIAIGFALGIIGGTIFVTYRAASSPQEFYGEGDKDGASLLLPPDRPFLPVANEPGLMLNKRWTF